MKSFINIAALLLLFLTSSCTQNLTGGSSDHGNANTTISVTTCDSTKFSGGTLKLVNKNYKPYHDISDSYNSTINFDSTGIINLYDIPIDSYSIIIFTADSQYSSLFTINIDSNDNSFKLNLTQSGSLTIPFDSSDFDPLTKYYIDELKMELDISVWNNSHNKIKVPEGKYTIHKFENSISFDSIIFDDISIESGYLTDMTLSPKRPQGADTIPTYEISIYYSFFYYKETMPWLNAEFIEFQFDWGDGSYSEWKNNTNAMHYWKSEGNYKIRVRIRYNDENNYDAFLSYWSEYKTVSVIENSD